MDDTPIDMKRKIYNHAKSVFKGEKPPSEELTEKFEEWLTTERIEECKKNYLPDLPPLDGLDPDEIPPPLE